jgi:hypothetical protein
MAGPERGRAAGHYPVQLVERDQEQGIDKGIHRDQLQPFFPRPD